jgi:hypothetical protein
MACVGCKVDGISTPVKDRTAYMIVRIVAVKKCNAQVGAQIDWNVWARKGAIADYLITITLSIANCQLTNELGH